MPIQGVFMKQAMRVALLLASVSSAYAGVPPGWAPVGERTYLVPLSIERFGSTIAFATAFQLRDQGDDWSFSWQWAHCKKDWVTDSFAYGPAEQLDLSAAYRAVAAEKQSFAYPVEFQPLASFPFGDGEALRLQLRGRCSSPQQSKDSTEVAISSSSKRDGVGQISLLLLRSVARRGDLAEGWIRKRPTKEVPVTYSDGKPLMRPDGKPLTRTTFTESGSEARFKVTADCKKGQIALSRVIEYDENGGVKYTEPAGAKLTFSEPTPETVGETYLEVLCRL
jgi:hypothetical protein